MLSAQCKCTCVCMRDETLYGVHSHMHNAHVHSRAFNCLALASHSWCGQKKGSSRSVDGLPIHHACMCVISLNGTCYKYMHNWWT